MTLPRASARLGRRISAYTRLTPPTSTMEVLLMGNHWLSPKILIYVSLLLFLSLAVACGGTSAEPQIIEREVIVEKEVIKEVPVEKQVIVREEVIREIIKEVPVEKEVIREVIREVIKEVPVEIVVERMIVPTAQPIVKAGSLAGFPKAGENGVPKSVGKLTMATDSWGGSDLNPWQLSGTTFLQDLFNLSIMRQAPNGDIAAYWAETFEQDEEGITFKLNPKAKFQDGSPADAQALYDNFQAIGWDWKKYGYENPSWTSGRTKTNIESMEVISPTELRITTKGPKPIFMWELGGNGYHGWWAGNPATLKKGQEEYLKDPLGGGPFSIAEWDPGTRIVLDRWDDFWADYEWYHAPQYEQLELLTVPDHAARFALLKSEQADMVYNVPWPVAKGLVRSEDFKRGINPEKGDLWTQTYLANGMLVLDFNLAYRLRQSKYPEGRVDKGDVKINYFAYPEGFEKDPTLDSRVRQALSLAIDRRAISKGPHFGMSFPIGSIWHAGSFGAREEVVFNPSPYNPERAKQLLAEAGYADGFEITGHFGQFAGRPGIPEAVDAISSYWQDIGVKVTWEEHDPSDFVNGFRFNRLKWTQVSLRTWGRQDNSGREAVLYRPSSGYTGVTTPDIVDLTFVLQRTTDVEEQERLLAEIEDRVLALNETFPLYGMTLVMGYTDRVLAHPTVKFSPHFKHLDLITLRD